MNRQHILGISQVINYIYGNIEAELTVDDVANYSCFSKYYFNRLFKAVTGESIYSFIKRLRLERAAWKLRTDIYKPITDIALEFGYSPSNFSSAFKEYFGVSAVNYRRGLGGPQKDTYLSVQEYIRNMREKPGFFNEISSKIVIKELESMNLLYEKFIGRYSDLKQAWCDFCDKVSDDYGIGQDSLFIGISYDDPIITDEGKCIYDMGVVTDRVIGANTLRIERGLYACYNFHDKLENIIKSYNEICCLWIPFCEYEIENKPLLEVYRSDMDEQGRMKIEFCIPIKK